MIRPDRRSFTNFLREQRRRLTMRWEQSEERIRETRQVVYTLETRKASGTAPLISGRSSDGYGVHQIGSARAGMAPGVYGVDDRDTNEGWR